MLQKKKNCWTFIHRQKLSEYCWLQDFDDSEIEYDFSYLQHV